MTAALRNKTTSAKHIAFALLAMAAALWMEASVAATGFVKGQVEFVRTHDASQLSGWAPPRFWFTLKDVTQAGACAKFAGDRVLFAPNDSQALKLVLFAQASGLEVAVAFDDTVRFGGAWCVPSYITIGAPAPLF